MVERVPMSKTGYDRLRNELEGLERKDRMEVISAIAEARGHGDLKENAEYHAAKDRQGFIESRIMELKDKLSRAEVIDCSRVIGDKVVFGVAVTVIDIDTNEMMNYQLLGPEEADIKQGTISVLSPWGKAMLGRKPGDEVKIKTPGGVRQMEIVEINAGKII